MSNGFISVDDHVLETPDLWTSRLSKDRWGDRIPRLEKNTNGQHWVCDGEILAGGLVGRIGALMEDRNEEPASWDDVPAEAYDPQARLKAMDTAGVSHSVLFPNIAGMAGEGFGSLKNGPRPAIVSFLNASCLYRRWTQRWRK
jgi:hypothetical protein